MENQEKQDVSRPHVHIFGEEVEPKQRRYRRHYGMGGIWGLGVLFVGVILLLTNTGVISGEIWNYILPLWPVLLILIGLRIISGSSPAAHLLVFLLTLAALCLIFLYGLNSAGSPLINYFHLPGEFMNFINQFK